MRASISASVETWVNVKRNKISREGGRTLKDLDNEKFEFNIVNKREPMEELTAQSNSC